MTACSNLIMNLIMVQFWGIYGVILSTVLSTLFVGMPWLLNNLFTVLFTKKELKSYLKHLAIYVGTTFFSCIVTYGACQFIHLQKWPLFIIRGIVCCILPNIVYIFFYYRMPEFKQSIQLIDKITKGKIVILKRMENKL